MTPAMSSIALTSVTLVAAVSFVRIFAEASSVVPIALAGLLAHATVAVARRARLPPAMTVVALIGGVVLLGTWTIVPSTTAYGLPTAHTLGELARHLEEGLGAIRTAKVPLEPGHSIVLVAGLGIWLAALAGDWVAFEARGALSATVPAATLFTVTAALGTERLQAPLVVVFVVATIVFVLIHAPTPGGTAPTWLQSADGSTGHPALLRAGLPVALLAAVAAPLVGPHLPEAHSSGLIDLKGGSPRARVTVSPIVDIQSQLTRQPVVEVFRVRADTPAYWRLAALEEYDGEIWSSLADYRSADGTLPPDAPAAPTQQVVQEYEITGLSQFWLPAAYRPTSISHRDARVNPDSLTLLTERETAAGLEYDVVSAVPTYTAADFARATPFVPDGVRDQLELPGGLDPSVEALARDISAGSSGPFAQARALQDHFRTNFEYSETVAAGHSENRLVDFLFRSRSGYCEQFASAFAVMARSLGLPARVAVGFTPGWRNPDGVHVVTSREAHAWPEVYIDPFGWVAFEPTPARFNPSPGDHTGTAAGAIPPGQPDSEGGTPGATATTQTTQPSDTPASGPATTSPAVDRAAQESGNGTSDDLPRFALAGALVVLATVGAVLAAVVRRRQIRRRRRLAPVPTASVLAAWDDVVERLRLDGLDLKPTLTPAEIAAVASHHDPQLREPIDALHPLVAAAAWSGRDTSPDDARAAWTLADRAVLTLDRDQDAVTRFRHAVGLRSRIGASAGQRPEDSSESSESSVRNRSTKASRSRR